jgi:hypothetical protein
MKESDGRLYAQSFSGLSNRKPETTDNLIDAYEAPALSNGGGDIVLCYILLPPPL